MSSKPLAASNLPLADVVRLNEMLPSQWMSMSVIAVVEEARREAGLRWWPLRTLALTLVSEPWASRLRAETRERLESTLRQMAEGTTGRMEI